MTIAAIRSNRGDIYQTLIAMDWAISVLCNQDLQWLEVDSTAFEVDDVVVGKSDGSVICCQCKKNHPDFRVWSISDLRSEIEKASRELAKTPHAQVRLYSRDAFGELAKLREFSTCYSNESDYHANLTKEHAQTDQTLASCIANHAPKLTTYEFLCRTNFEPTDDYDRLEGKLREHLQQIASNSRAAFDALWTRLDQLGGRIENGNLSASAQHRLTKADLTDILNQAGALLTPTVSIAEVRSTFASTSVVGRSWQRDISGEHIASPAVQELLNAIDTGKHSILLTGQPGSGKTCVMLNLQDELERRAQTSTALFPLFIQSREFADLATAQERQAQGLSEQWVEQAARLAEEAHVVVVIDSLDVLSIAREHSILTYFLAQIDRLLLIPDITIVTACRDFDRKYDRRIATRKWDCEIQCQPLDWTTDVEPLLTKLEIDAAPIDSATRELIQNPRELALFVDLARNGGSFNVVTSQALAQRYLDTIVQADPALGSEAMQAIEAISKEMLHSRRISVHPQRFNASQNILRQLQSLNVLQRTHDGSLTFGHQTLLDVLVISNAIRRGISLNEFIGELPPVPFVRPSIRSFVAQLATGDRAEFRKQLRAVLTGDAAFHIRRLVAESFAKQMPQDDDWPLIRDLRNDHREMFLAIYTQASAIEWHHFWLTHLVPGLKEKHDAEGMAAHVNRVGHWQNMDAVGVCAFWVDTLELGWLDRDRTAEQVVFSLLNLSTDNLALAVPLIERLISMPIPEYSQLGHIVSRGVTAGVIDDSALWHLIIRDVTEENTRELFGRIPLHCEPHEFGFNNEDYLAKRMVQSTALLDLAISSVEEWGPIRTNCYGDGYVRCHHGFLDHTSYNDVHSRTEFQITDSNRILFNAIETAILGHAETHSEWWQNNRERLCFNQEGALCYFAILAFLKHPQLNIDLIGRLLSRKEFLDSMLSYELGSLCREAFIYLDEHTQDTVMATIQSLGEESEAERKPDCWILKPRAEYISTIPCHLRSKEAQAILNEYENTCGTLIRQPLINMRSGTVAPPFSFKVFLSASDDGIIHLLDHYAGYNRRDFDDFLIGGEQEVGRQLREASSRQPSRFLEFIVKHWANIPVCFINDIMDGIANYLSYRHGRLQSDKTWEPTEEPDAPKLANRILDELERHSTHWQINRSAANALEACAYVIQDTQDAARLVFLAIGFNKHQDFLTTALESADLLDANRSAECGIVADALMILINNLHERKIVLPELLPPTLLRYAGNEHPYIRIQILERLPYLQCLNPELGWDIFQRSMLISSGLWRTAERCLYYTYHNHFEKVAPLLDRICSEGTMEDMETWGRISALSSLSGHIALPVLIEKLNTLYSPQAWQGAMSVWTNIGNIRQHEKLCFTGIEAGLNADKSHAKVSVRHVENIFHEIAPPVFVPPDLVQLCFNVLENDSEGNKHRVFGFDKWLNAISERDPVMALAITEMYLDYVRRAKPYFSDYENQLVQLVTRLFVEAEEREESDSGEMLKRVVAVQDMLLSLGLDSIDAWLKSAERP